MAPPDVDVVTCVIADVLFIAGDEPGAFAGLVPGLEGAAAVFVVRFCWFGGVPFDVGCMAVPP